MFGHLDLVFHQQKKLFTDLSQFVKEKGLAGWTGPPEWWAEHGADDPRAWLTRALEWSTQPDAPSFEKLLDLGGERDELLHCPAAYYLVALNASPASFLKPDG